MNTKHYLTAILIFTTFLLSCFSAKSQNISETITIARKGIGYAYYQNGKVLNFSQLLSLTKENTEAYNFLIKADNWKITGLFFGVIGGGCLGYSLGYALGAAMAGNSINMKILLPVSLVGTGLTFCSFIFEIVSKDNIRKGVDIYNNSIKQKNNPNIDIGISTNGMMFRLNF